MEGEWSVLVGGNHKMSDEYGKRMGGRNNLF